jgi:hypothetical protein
MRFSARVCSRRRRCCTRHGCTPTKETGTISQLDFGCGPCRVNVARGQPRCAALRACAYFTGVPSCSPRHEHARAGNKAAPLRLFYCSKAAVMAMHLAAAATTSLQPNRLTLHSADRLLSLTSPPLALRHRGCRPASRPAICRHHDGFLGHAQLHRAHPRREVDGAQRFA